MLKKITILIVLLISLFLLKSPTYAQEDEAPNESSIPSVFESPVILDPPSEEIDGNTPAVEITFSGLEPNSTWHICSKAKCNKATDEEQANGDGELILTVCAANDERLKRVGFEDESCGDGDYFHEGKVYTLTLFEDEEQERRGPFVKFFINHFYPDVTVSTNNGLLEVSISGDRRPGPNRNKNRNNYQVVVEGEDIYKNKYKGVKCTTIESDGGYAVATFGKSGEDDPDPIWAGDYLVKVNEQVNEGTWGKIKSGFDGCNGGFTYWHIDAEINNNKELVPPQIVCSGTTDQNPAQCTMDPNFSDVKGFNKLMESLGAINTFQLRCNKYTYNEDNEVECLEINTAIGSIPTDPLAFIERLFSIVLTLAGVAALGLLIYGGYNYMISRGDPEKIKGARETITSAIIGLLFIIFSLVILQVIAGDILNIPGFTTP